MHQLDVRALRGMLQKGLENMFKDRTLMNDINVFPVADGDTGDNLYNTCLPLYQSLEGLYCEDPTNLLDHLSNVLLPAARGNSGVIFSQFMYSFTSAMGHRTSLSTAEFGRAMGSAVEEAYQAVVNPKEGTILTVMKQAAVDFTAFAEEGLSFEEIFRETRRTTRAALERTKEILPACRKAGVVDSGAMGFYLFYEGMEKGILHEELEERELEGLHTAIVQAPPPSEYEYCAQWFIAPNNKPRAFFIQQIQPFGDSIAIVGDAQRLNIHIHTSKPEHVEEAILAHAKVLGHKLEPLVAHRGGTGIVIDSCTDLPDEILEEFGISMVPLTITVGDKGYKDRLQMTKEEFYRRLDDPSADLKTSQPAPIAFTQAYQRALKIYDDLLVLAISSRLSGTYNSALAGVRMLPGEKQGRVTVVDTLTLSAGSAHLAFKALEWIEDGLGAVEVGRRIGAIRNRVVSVVYLDTLDNAVRSGRVPSASGYLVKRLGIRPLVEVRNGLLKKAGLLWSARGKEKKAVGMLLKQMDPLSAWSVGIVYTTTPEVVPRLEEEIFKSKRIIRRLFSTHAAPVLGLHAGGGAFALFAMPED